MREPLNSIAETTSSGCGRELALRSEATQRSRRENDRRFAPHTLPSPKNRGSLGAECGDRFARVFGARHLADAPEFVVHLRLKGSQPARMHQALCRRVCARRPRRKLGRERVRLLRKPIIGHHPRCDSPFDRLSRREGAIEICEFDSAAHANQARQKIGRGPIGAEPDLRVGHRKLRRFRGHHQVARAGQPIPAPAAAPFTAAITGRSARMIRPIVT